MIFSEVKVIEPDVYSDYRGDLWTIWNKDTFTPKLDFNHDKISTSRHNVLRGIHGDFKSWKLINCLFGEIYFVVVDNRIESPNYLKWDWIILSDKNKKSVLLPPFFGNGFYVLSEMCVFHYKWAYSGNYPDVNEQFTLKWNDPKLNIEWPTNTPILQKRDK